MYQTSVECKFTNKKYKSKLIVCGQQAATTKNISRDRMANELIFFFDILQNNIEIF